MGLSSDSYPSNTDKPEQLTAHEQAVYARYLRKVDMRVLPVFFVCYWLAVLDRNNIGTANVASPSFSEHLHLKRAEFNWIVSALFYTYIFCEVPSTMLLQKFGVSKWLPTVTVCWGISCTCMAVVSSYASAIVVRLILGVFEAGLVPGFLYYSTVWYPNVSRASRITLFFSAGTFSGIFAGPIAAGLKNIKGSLLGYQYIFLVQGVITVFVGFAVIFVVSDYPETAKFITPEELQVAQKVFGAEQINTSKVTNTAKQKLQTLTNWKLWVFGVIFAMGAIAGATQAIFGPTLIRQMGYTSTTALVLSSIPSGMGFISQMSITTLFLFAKPSKIRASVLIIIYSAMSAIFYVLLAVVKPQRARLTFLALANFSLSPTMPLASYWMTTNIFKPRELAVGSSMTIMLGGVAGLIGSYIYTATDAPFYKTGHLIIFGGFCFTTALAILLSVYFKLMNRRSDRIAQQTDIVANSQPRALINPENIRWRYTL